MTRHLLALEATLLAGAGPTYLDEAVDAADALARHVTRPIGGVRWRRAGARAGVTATRSATVVGIAAGLRLLAEALPPRATRGIDAEVRLRATSAELVLVAPEATAAIYRAAGAELRACTPSSSGPSVESGARGITLILAPSLRAGIQERGPSVEHPRAERAAERERARGVRLR